MQGLIRPFDRHQHRLYDQPGKAAMAAYWRANHCEVVLAPFGEHGVDLMVTPPSGLTFYCEPEVRGRAWREGPWPYPTVHVVERKTKYTRLDRPVVFASIRGDLRAAMLVEGAELTPDRLERNPINAWENVYSVPRERTRFVLLPDVGIRIPAKEVAA